MTSRTNTDRSGELAFRRVHVGRALARAFWLFEEQVERGIHAHGFEDYRNVDARVLRYLPTEGGARVVELAERAGMTKQGMSKLVAGLEARGYLERRPDVDDGRAQRVLLTPRGRALLEAAGRAIADLEAQWADVVGAEQLAGLKATLLALADALGPDDYL
jgi:DNA-binding MarR family transcriptional regulator